MDQATRNARRRAKVLRTKRGELSQFESKGLGRKLKNAETFPLRQCDHIDGGKKITFARERRDGTKYLVSVIKGGIRCPETADLGQKCRKHRAELRKNAVEEIKETGRARPKRKKNRNV
jgi:hypothetical protein